jgi:hypothetical protein
MLPPRVIVALAIIAILIGIGVWGIVAVLRSRRLTTVQRTVGITTIVGVAALLTAWVIFAGPAYWD